MFLQTTILTRRQLWLLHSLFWTQRTTRSRRWRWSGNASFWILWSVTALKVTLSKAVVISPSPTQQRYSCFCLFFSLTSKLSVVTKSSVLHHLWGIQGASLASSSFFFTGRQHIFGVMAYFGIFFANFASIIRFFQKSMCTHHLRTNCHLCAKFNFLGLTLSSDIVWRKNSHQAGHSVTQLISRSVKIIKSYTKYMADSKNNENSTRQH